MALGDITMASELMGGYEILDRPEYHALSKTLNISAEAKAGSIVTSTGAVITTGSTSGATIMGILLDDVKPEFPQGTVVVDGFINKARATAHSGVTSTNLEAVATAIPTLHMI